MRTHIAAVLGLVIAVAGCQAASNAAGGPSPDPSSCSGYRVRHADGTVEARYCVGTHDVEGLDLEIQQKFDELGDSIDELKSDMRALKEDSSKQLLSSKLDELSSDLDDLKFRCTGRIVHASGVGWSPDTIDLDCSQ